MPFQSRRAPLELTADAKLETISRSRSEPARDASDHAARLRARRSRARSLGVGNFRAAPEMSAYRLPAGPSSRGEEVSCGNFVPGRLPTRNSRDRR